MQHDLSNDNAERAIYRHAMGHPLIRTLPPRGTSQQTALKHVGQSWDDFCPQLIPTDKPPSTFDLTRAVCRGVGIRVIAVEEKLH